MKIETRTTITTSGAAPTAARRAIEAAAPGSAAPVVARASAVAAADAASNTPRPSTAQSARQKIDADYAKARDQGTRVVADIAKGGRALDLSALSDDEVAAAALNRDGSFTSDEKLTAQAELAGRMWQALGPFDTGHADNTGVQTAIKAIYPALSADVREALGWTPDMLAMGDKIIAATPSGKKAHRASFFDLFAKGQASPGALRIDVTRLQDKAKGSVVDITG